jgi:hypothetical protein
MSVTFKADMSGITRMLEALGTDVETAARPAAAAGAEVLKAEVLRNVATLKEQSGKLREAIYKAYSQSQSGPGRATYHVSWRVPTKKKGHLAAAPHGHLIENGHWMRYAVARHPKTGRLYTLVRPEKRGQPRPKARASEAEKAAYYLPRPGGPLWVEARPFIRPAQAKFGEALAVAEAELLRRLGLL